MAIKVVRAKRDRELSKAQLAKRETLRRRHEVDAQIVNMIQKEEEDPATFNVERLLTHPAGLMGKGSAGHLHADRGQEERWIRNRYCVLKERFEKGEEFKALDDEIAKMIRDGDDQERINLRSEIRLRAAESKAGTHGESAKRFHRGRAHKDLSELKFQEEGVVEGFLFEVSHEELIEEHLANVVQYVEQINAEAAELGLSQRVVIEE